MKKLMFIGILLTSMLFSVKAFGQEVLITETFEDYPVGSKLVQEAKMLGRMYWDTWSGVAGYEEDATITSDQVQEGSKAAKFVLDNDVILLLGNKISGAYRITFYMYVPAGKVGYFNILHKPAVGGQQYEHAMEMYFNANQSITLKANVDVSGTYTQATWMKIVMNFDLDEDVADIAINDNVLHTWKFSLKPGGAQGTKQLGALDLFGGSGSTVFDYYVDNLVYEQTSDVLPLPIVTVIPDNIVKELKTNETGNTVATVNNEGVGTQDATWAAYIKYPDLDGTDLPSFDMILCDEATVGQGGTGYLTTSNYIIEMAMRLTPADYQTKIGGEITEVSYFVREAPDVPIGGITYRIYGQGKESLEEGEMLAEKVLPAGNVAPGTWNSITFDAGVKLLGGEYWIAVEFEAPPTVEGAGPYPLVLDAGPAKWGGDWHRTNKGTWMKLSQGSAGTDRNFAIKAKGSGKVRDAFVVADKTFETTKPGESTPLTLMFSAGTYPEDTYEATLVVLSNDENNPVIEVPITMIVNDQAKKTNANIKEIIVNDSIATVNPDNELIYRVTVPCTEKIFIAATPEDEDATVTGDLGEHEVKCLSSNTYSITVTAEDGETVKNYTLTVLVEKKDDGISELNNSVKLFPNPVADYLYIDSEFPIEYITIYDLTGKMMKQIRQTTTIIDLKDLATGVYLMRITTEQGEAVHKFVKQ